MSEATNATPTSRLMQGVIPYIAVKNADDAIAFYRDAFGAIVRGEAVRDESGRIMNATLEVNGGGLMLMEHLPELGEPPAKGGHSFTLQLVSNDGEEMWERAVAAGCTISMPFETQFWGDRYGRLDDPFGLVWAINEPSAESRAAHRTSEA